MTDSNPSGGWTRTLLMLAGALLAGIAGGWTAGTITSGSGDDGVRDYLLANPEVLPEAMQELQRREQADRLAPVQTAVTEPFPGAVLGNPQGTKVLVEFSDYACGYCRQSVADVEALVAADPDLKVVIRELPILSPDSFDAAQMALAAAEQGKFEAFHTTMFEAGRVTPETILASARTAGVDVGKAQAAIAADRYRAEVEKNLALSETLGIGGTPAWVAGDTVLAGAIGQTRLAAALGDD